jgi:hypothetical protein
MTTACDLRLTSFGPIVEVLYRLERRADGWCLWVRHRHYAGLFADCPAGEYTRLTLEELYEVMAVELFLQEDCPEV